MKRVAALVAALLTVVSCADPADHGVVVDRRYTAPYETTSWHCYYRNEDGICMMNLPVTVHHSATWEVAYTGTDSDGEPDTWWIEVTEDAYAFCTTGRAMVGALSDAPHCEGR